MAKVLVSESHLLHIANAIRTKNGTQNSYTPAEMAEAISDIESGYPEPSGTVNITQNGTTNVKDYASANVNVPNTYSAGDEGKVVDNGELVAQTSTTFTENGTYDTTMNDEVVVNVSGGSSGGKSIVEPVIITASSTYSGLYSANNAFDKSSSNFWGSNGGSSDWLKIQFFEAVKITKIKFANTLNTNSLHWSSTRVVFQGSNDGNTWTDLYDATNLTDSNDNLYEYALQNNTEYIYYRFLCYKGTFYAGIGKVEFEFESQESSGSGSGSLNRYVLSAENGTITYVIDDIEGARIYFSGFTKIASDVAFPEGFPVIRGLDYSKAYGPDKETQIGHIGWYNGNIRSWTSNTASTLAGTFWGVVYIGGGQGQTNAYEEPPQAQSGGGGSGGSN